MADVRRINFCARIERMGGQQAFINKTNYNQGQVSALMNGGRNMGEKLARKLERLAGWPTKSLDVSHDGGEGDPIHAVEAAFRLMPYVDDKEREYMMWHIKRLRESQLYNKPPED